MFPWIRREQIIGGGEIMVAALGGDQLELQKFKFMIGHSFPSITRRQPNWQRMTLLIMHIH